MSLNLKNIRKPEGPMVKPISFHDELRSFAGTEDLVELALDLRWS
jgi:hypothetical protein